MTARNILLMFDDYKKARITFVQNVVELALRQQNIEILKSAGILDLLYPLMGDVCIQIRQCTVIALGRLANHNKDIAQKIIDDDFFTIMFEHLNSKNKYYKKATMFVMRSVCKHDEKTAADAINTTICMQALLICLTDLDPGVKESAAWAIGYIARHNETLARTLVDAGVAPHLVLCLQEPEICIKCVAASALADIAKHSSDLAQSLQEANAIGPLVKAMMNHDEKLKRQTLIALSAIARHNIMLAEAVVQAEVFPSALIYMNHSCELVKRNATILVKDVVKHSIELSELVMNMGGVGALIETIRTKDGARLTAITALGFMAGHSLQMSTCVTCSDGVTVLADVLTEDCEDELLTVTAWALGQLALHCPEQVAKADVLPRLLELYENEKVSQELRTRCSATLKQSVHGCTNLVALEPLLQRAPPDLLKHVLAQFVKILPNDPRARRVFVSSGGLRRIQEIEAEPGSTLLELITKINACFPDEIVRYFSPGYCDTLLEKVEQFIPQIDEDAYNSEGNIFYDKQYPSVSTSQEFTHILN